MVIANLDVDSRRMTTARHDVIGEHLAIIGATHGIEDLHPLVGYLGHGIPSD